MLYLTMRFHESEMRDGVLLAWSEGQMRIAMEDCTDVVELRQMEGRWTLDDGTWVELDGLFTDGNTDVALFRELYPQALAAGQLGAAAVALSWSRHQPVPATCVH